MLPPFADFAKITSLLLGGFCSILGPFGVTVWLLFELELELDVLDVIADAESPVTEFIDVVRWARGRSRECGFISLQAVVGML